MQLGDARPPPRLPGFRDSKGGRVTSRKIYLHARTREGERAGEILFRPRSSCDDPSKRKEKKEERRRDGGNAEETTLCGVWERSAKSIGSHSKDDRAIDAHHELHTNIGVH